MIIVKTPKSLPSSSDKAIKRDSAKRLQDLEAQWVALKVRLVRGGRKPALLAARRPWT